MIKTFTILIMVVLAGCAADPKKLSSVSSAEAGRLAKPTKPLSAFLSYELRPLVLSHAIKGDAAKVAQATVLENRIRNKLLPLFANWSSLNGSNRSGTLIVQPELAKLRIVSSGARFWAGVMAGSSNVELNLSLIDGSTEKLIANPRVTKAAGAWAGGWSIGQSDKNLHDYIAHIVHRYFEENY